MFGARLAAERKRLGLSQKKLAEWIGIGRSAIGMIETDRAPLDAQRLVDLGADGFDVLFVLTGEPSKVAAAQLIDWDLALAVLQKVRDWSGRRGLTIPAEKQALLVKYLYIHVAQRGRVDEEAMDELLRMAA